MLPIVTFPQVTICGTKEDCLKWTDNHCTFKAMLNAQQGGLRSIYIFNAFDEVADKIKRMKVTAKSECTIIAEMRDYIDRDNVRRQSFTVKMIDFVRTNDSFSRPPKENKNEPAEENKTVENITADNSANSNQRTTSTKVPDGLVDLDEFAKLFGGN